MKYLWILLVTLPLSAQQTPELSATEKLAISAIQQEVAQINKQTLDMQAEVTKKYPGYQIDFFKTWTLQPIPKPAEPPKPEKK